MICHIVPQVYLRQWKISCSKNSIFIFAKDRISEEGERKKIDILNDTHFVEKDLFLLDMNNDTYFHMIKAEFIPLFDYLKKYQCVYNEKEINTFDDFANNFIYFSKWDIRDSNNLKMSNKKIKIELEKIWENIILKRIENYLSYNIETSWNLFLQNIKQLLQKKTWKVKAINKAFFLEFFSIQLCRQYDYLIKIGINDIIELLLEVFEADNDTENELQSRKFKNDLCLMQLYKYVCYAQTMDKSYEDNAITKTIEVLSSQFQISFLISSDANFITTDNPCLKIGLNSVYDQHFSGLFIPIMPNVCAYLAKKPVGNTLNKYLLISVSNNNVKYINHLLMSHSLKNIAYHSNSLKGLFCTQPDIDSWKCSLNDVEIDFVDPRL